MNHLEKCVSHLECHFVPVRWRKDGATDAWMENAYVIPLKTNDGECLRKPLKS